MVFNWVVYWEHIFDNAAVAESYGPLASLISYLLLFLCTIVVAALGVPMAADAISFRRSSFRFDADALIVIGVAAAYLLSAVNTVRGSRHLYFDTAAIILVLVTLGKYLDALTRTKAVRAVYSGLSDLPRTVHVERNGQTIGIDTAELRVGDLVQVRSGEMLAIDGRVLRGSAHLDESHMTGESRPRSVAAGDDLLAGSIPVDGSLWVSAQSVGDDTAAAHVRRLLDQARRQQPRIQRLADRAAAIFVPAVITIALAVCIHHVAAGNVPRGLLDGLSVLLISCPCALGLAAPLATWAALGRAARRGVIIESGRAMETAARVRHVFCDKTGTLTLPSLSFVDVKTFDPAADDDDALALAAAIASSTTHPVAAALTAAARQRQLQLPAADDVQVMPGMGVIASVAGRRMRLGRREILPDLDIEPGDGDMVNVFLTDDRRAIARFRFAEQLRPDAAAAVSALRDMHVSIEVLTGDGPSPAERVGRALDIPVHHQLLPADKVEHVCRRQSGRQRSAVAMVGDGINDAPVLAAADVGFAVGSATDLARQAGHVHLTGPSLLLLPHTLTLARHTMRRIRLNLLWAFGYNTLGIALAAWGVLTPVIAALAMLGSSLLIIITSRGAGDIDLRPAQAATMEPAAQSLPADPANAAAERQTA